MDKKTEETTNTDKSEPIVSWSGVQGETQSEHVDIPNEKEVTEDVSGENSDAAAKPPAQS